MASTVCFGMEQSLELGTGDTKTEPAISVCGFDQKTKPNIIVRKSERWNHDTTGDMYTAGETYSDELFESDGRRINGSACQQS